MRIPEKEPIQTVTHERFMNDRSERLCLQELEPNHVYIARLAFTHLKDLYNPVYPTNNPLELDYAGDYEVTVEPVNKAAPELKPKLFIPGFLAAPITPVCTFVNLQHQYINKYYQRDPKLNERRWIDTTGLIYSRNLPLFRIPDGYVIGSISSVDDFIHTVLSNPKSRQLNPA